MKTNMKLLLLAILSCVSMYSFAQYTDLPANIDWSGGNIANANTTVDNVETAYNNARTQENTALGTSIPMIDFPSNNVWVTMTPIAQAFWIINQERTARGLLPLEDTAQQATDVAQAYNDYLVDNDTSGHFADGLDPLIRLQTNADIAACITSYRENVGWTFSLGNPTAPTNAIERIIYWLIYEDASSSWGHRRNFFYSGFNDDAGEVGKEGLIGIGYTMGQNYNYYNPGDGKYYLCTYAAIATFDIVDPCASWVFPPKPPVSVSISNVENSKGILYPTIANNTINITATNISSVSIINSIGAVIKVIEKDFTNILVSDLPDGLYIAIISYNDGSNSKEKFQIKN